MTDQPGSTTPPPLTSDDRNWAVIAHLSGFVAAYVALGIIGPTIVYFVKGQSSAFVRAHAVEAINFNITVLIGIFIGVPLAFVGIGFIILAIVGLVYLICTIRAAMAAQKGDLYRYPMTLRLIS